MKPSQLNLDYTVLILYNVFLMSCSVQLILADHPVWAFIILLLVGGSTSSSKIKEEEQPKLNSEKETNNV